MPIYPKHHAEVRAKPEAKERSPEVPGSNNLKGKLHCRYSLVFCAAFLLGMAVIGGGEYQPAAGAAEVPRAVTGATSHNFGKVFEHQALTHTFLIRNTGTAPLKIEEVDPDCACTVASYEKTIPPGGQADIVLTIKPFSVLHQFKKMTKVRLNDPERPLVHLTVAGNAQPCFDIQPNKVVRLTGRAGEDIRSQVRIVTNLATPWQIREYRTTIPDKIEVTLKPEVPDKSYVLVVNNKSQQEGAYTGLIELFTTAEQKPRLTVRVMGKISKPSGPEGPGTTSGEGEKPAAGK